MAEGRRPWADLLNRMRYNLCVSSHGPRSIGCVNFPSDADAYSNKNRDYAGPHRKNLGKREPIAKRYQKGTDQKRDPNTRKIGRFTEQR